MISDKAGTSLTGRMPLSVLLLVGLIACRNEDRMLTVGCGGQPSANIAIEMSNLGTPGSNVGLLDIPHFVPGTILQLTPTASNSGRGIGTAVYVLRTSDEDFLPPRPEAWFNKVVSAHFDLEMDEDVRHVLQPPNVESQNTILSNTEVWMRSMQRMSLREPLQLINSDKVAVGIIRGATGTNRFALVSEVSYGKQAFLYYPTPPALANNLIEVSKFYLHIKYACPALTALGSASQSATLLPVVFIQIPVKYDPLSGMVTIDASPIDLFSFDFMPASMR